MSVKKRWVIELGSAWAYGRTVPAGFTRMLTKKTEKGLSWKSWVRIGVRYGKPDGHTGDKEVRNHVIIYSEGQRMWSALTQKGQPG